MTRPKAENPKVPLSFSATAEEKEAWTAAAEDTGQSLSEFLRDAANRALTFVQSSEDPYFQPKHVSESWADWDDPARYITKEEAVRWANEHKGNIYYGDGTTFRKLDPASMRAPKPKPAAKQADVEPRLKKAK